MMTETPDPSFSEKVVQGLFEQALHVRGTPPPPAPPEFWEHGDFPYQIESFAGRGSSGFVWKAIPRKGGVPVALKLIPFRGETERLRYRWAIEVAALEKLVHPNLVRIVDHGLAANADAGWLALEWINGSTLAEVLRDQSRIPWQTALQLCIQACNALAVIHATGLIHRDIKPSNLLLEKETGRLVVADLGISLDLGENPDARLTRTLERAATPGYAPPEQFTAHYSPTPAGDQYSLAVTLWEIITGTRPAGAFPRLHSIVKTPAALDLVLRRALDPDPARRFPSITAFSNALRQSSRWHASLRKSFGLTLLLAILTATAFTISHSATPFSAPSVGGTTLPMRFQSGTLPVPGSSNGYMSADMTLNKDGAIVGTVHTFTLDNFRGFTGQIIITLRDRGGNIVHQRHSADFGINGKWIPGQKPDRTDEWHFDIPPEDAARVASAEFAPSIADRPWSHRFKENREDLSKDVKKLLSPGPEPAAPAAKPR